MPLNNVYNGILKGVLTATGNTLVIAGNSTIQSTFLLTPSNTTTTNWTLCGSTGNLSILPDSNIVKATLYWYGTVILAGISDVSANQDDPINLTLPIGSVQSVTPTSFQNTGIRFRSADVTNLVTQGGSGTYTVSRVPVAISPTGATSSCRAGWVLIVVYSNSTQKYRSISYDIGVQPINQTTPSVDISLTNFVTPPNPPQKGFLLAGAADGDSTIDGSTIRVGPTTANLVNIGNTVSTGNPNPGTSPNNPNNAFFSGQINNCNPLSSSVGLLDTTGTRVTVNHLAFPPTLINTARNKWDLSMVDISSTLTQNQSTLTARAAVGAGANAAMAVNMLGVMGDINAPNFTPILKTVDKEFADIGDTINYTISFKNSGTTVATNAIFIDTIPIGTSFINGSVVVNNISQTATNPQNGINLGDIGINQSTTITFSVIVTTIPTVNPIPNSSILNYTFDPGAGANPISASEISNTVYTKVNHVYVGTTKVVNKDYVNVGDILTYTIVISAIGSTTANFIIFSDTIPSGTSFVSGSLTQNGSPLAGNPNPPGVSLNNISQTGVTTVSFNVKVDTIPSPNPIPNSATTTYTYLIDSTLSRSNSGSTNSNTVKTQVNNANLGNIAKYVDKSYATCNETINYTIVIPNNGNVTAQNIIFKDTIPNGTVFVANSVTVNNVSQSGANVQSGVTIPNIAPGTTTTVTFKVKVQC